MRILPILRIKGQDLFSVKRKDIINYSNHRKFQERTVRTRTRYPEAIRAGYILNNPNACSSYKKVSCLILVYSKVTYWRVREILRHTWINATLYQPYNVVFMFLIGTSDDPKLQDIIKNESAKYQDIVQGDFVDSYRNLTNKGVMGLRWVTENCRNAEMVIKIDDDAFINIFKLLKDFSHLKERKKFIYCNKIEKDDMPIERNKRNKWYVQEDSFRGYSYYPHTYCSGIVVFLSIDIIPSLYRAAMATPFFWVDDFYLFGILPSKIPGVRYEDMGGNFTDRHRDIIKCLNEKKIQCQYVAMMTKFIRITKIWDAVLQNLL
ncbi:hypothetical protein FSP39_006917 [Pinctada imbricata]|uniref:Hexosyltransferase n=1 Tax=Pinctada imbricata TaxID=66713 RepID=A0AA88YK19_PINIB|nr:hypothetical protein FSP39_006917 [Pinctada imbricata]